MNKMQKAVIVAIVTMALGAGVSAKNAWAAYGLPIGPCPSCNSVETINVYGDSANINNAYVPPSGSTDGSVGANNLVFTPPSGLTQVASMVTPYTTTPSGAGSFSGYAASSVWKTSTGTLDFFYQFDVTSVGSNAATPSSLGISPFNQPGNTAYNLALGINSSTAPTSTGGTTVTYDPLSIGANSTPVDLQKFFNSPTPLNLDYGTGGTVLGGNNTPIYNMTAGQISPQFFVATNATYFGMGIFTIQSSTGVEFAPAFVPDSPEPGTVVLFGSGLALLSFVMLRKKGGLSIG